MKGKRQRKRRVRRKWKVKEKWRITGNDILGIYEFF